MNLIFRILKVLIVEDEKIIAKDIEATIRRLGHDPVGVVSTAEDAVKKAGELKPGLILMDITLKGETDGIEAAKVINDMFGIPIVYLTAHQDEDTIERSKSTNPYGFITKPLDDRDINSAINAAIYRYDVEMKLKEAEERYFRLAENAVDIIFSQSIDDLSYNYVNKATTEITGYTPEEFYMTPNLMEKIVHPDWLDDYRKNYRNILRKNDHANFEYRVLPKQGGECWLNQRSVIVKDDEGKPVIIEAIVTDVTERKIYQRTLEETTEKLRAFSNHLQKVREDERLLISREIHDQLGQDLTVLKMELSLLKKRAGKNAAEKSEMKKWSDELGKISNSIDGIINNVRRIATDLRPDVLDKLGLVDAIEWHSSEFEKRTRIKCETSLTEDEFTLNPEKAISVFRVFQEAMTNIARHSGAVTANISLGIENGWLVLNIADNGKGITPEEIEKNTSLGILGMKERIMLLGGLWSITGTEGKGSVVEIKVPLDEPSLN